MPSPASRKPQTRTHLVTPNVRELRTWMKAGNVTALIHAVEGFVVEGFRWPDELQVEIARYDSEALRATLARGKNICREAIEILFAVDSPEVHFELLHAGHLNGRRAAKVRRELVDSRHTIVRLLAARLQWLTEGDRSKLLSDPQACVRHQMVLRSDLTAEERMKICAQEVNPEIIRGFFVMGRVLSGDELGVLVPRMIQQSVVEWWGFLTNAVKSAHLPNHAQLSVAKCGDAVLRAHLAHNKRCCPDALQILSNDSSPTVLFAVLQAGHLDEMSRADLRGRLVNSGSASTRGLAAQLDELRVESQRASLLSDQQWTVRAAMAVRKDLSLLERLHARMDHHPGVRRAFAGRDDLVDDEVLDLENDSRRGVVSAIAYNKKVSLHARARALERLEHMPKEAPVANEVDGLMRFPLAPTREGVPILGFKSWTVRFNSVLCSWWRDELWESSVKLATCVDPITEGMDPESSIPHKSPHECGLYASHDTAVMGHQFRVMGAVLGRGEVAVHEEGWRSQEMEIIALCPSSYHFTPEEMEEADAIGAIMNVPVMSKTDLEVYSRHFGQTIYKSLAQVEVEKQEKQIKDVWGLS